MVQDRTISHRIGGLTADDVDIPKELNFVDPAQEVVGPDIIMDPPGFEYWLGTFPFGEWETADIDWSTGTVAGLRRPDGTRARLPVELRWSELAKIAAIWRNDMQRARRAERRRRGGATATKRKHGGGRSYDPHDMPLLDEMKRLIDALEVENMWRAALAVADKARGSRELNARAKRLLDKFQKRSVLNASERN
jgi:hypothetical protein